MPRSKTEKLLTCVGVMAGVGLWGASILMNYRHGVSMGDTELDQNINMVVAIASDFGKLVCPFILGWAVLNKRAGVFLAAISIWVLTGGYSLTNAVGFRTENRVAVTSERSADSTQVKQDGTAKKRLNARLVALGEYRPSGVVQTELETRQRHHRWGATKKCTDDTAPKSILFCNEYRALQKEFETAKAATEIEDKITVLETRIEKNKKLVKGDEKGDPKVSFISKLSGYKFENVETVLDVWVVLLVEIGSTLLIFVSTVFGGNSGTRKSAPTPPMPEVREAEPLAVVAKPVGDIAKFVAQRTESIAGESIAIDAPLYGAYCRWCETAGYDPVAQDAFNNGFTEICKVVGIENRKSSGVLVAVDLRLAA